MAKISLLLSPQWAFGATVGTLQYDAKDVQRDSGTKMRNLPFSMNTRESELHNLRHLSSVFE